MIVIRLTWAKLVVFGGEGAFCLPFPQSMRLMTGIRLLACLHPAFFGCLVSIWLGNFSQSDSSWVHIHWWLLKKSIYRVSGAVSHRNLN